ncbi:thermonuclease family protein [Roseovarius spongiae]|nr:thermonuclease family protein [Roseovarius spongiae]
MRRNNVIRFRRGARRHPRWDLGTPPDQRNPSRLRRLRHADPTIYLKGVIGLGVVGLIILPLGADALNAIAGARPASGDCRVLSVTDGDTVRMYCPGHGIESARLMGFDTPEKFSPRCASEWTRAVKATWALRRMLWQADGVSLVRSGTDRYGRALVTMTLDGAPVARRMIEAGLSRPYAGGVRQGWCDA